MILVSMVAATSALFASLVIGGSARTLIARIATLRAQLAACPDTLAVRVTIREVRMQAAVCTVHVLPVRRPAAHVRPAGALRAAA